MTPRAGRKLAREIDGWKADYEDQHTRRCRAEYRAIKAEREVERLREALRKSNDQIRHVPMTICDCCSKDRQCIDFAGDDAGSFCADCITAFAKEDSQPQPIAKGRPPEDNWRTADLPDPTPNKGAAMAAGEEANG